MVTGLAGVASVILQPLLAAVTARHPKFNDMKNVMALKLAAILMAVLLTLPLPGAYSVAVLFCVMAALDASMPSMLSNVAMECVNKGYSINYGLARGSGSIACSLFCVVLGNLIEAKGTGSLLSIYIVTSAAVVLMMFYFAGCVKKMDEEAHMTAKEKTVPEGGREEQDTEQNGNILKKYPFLFYFLCSSVLLFMVHNMLNVFLINIVENVGGNNTDVGNSLAIAAAVELPMMVSFVALSKRFKVENILLFSSVIFTVKAAVILLAGNIFMIYLDHVIQIGAFALFTPASVYFINKAMKQEDRGVGQALLGACSIGMGGALGNLIGGVIIDNAGVKVMMTVGVVLSMIAVAVMAQCIKKYTRSKENE